MAQTLAQAALLTQNQLQRGVLEIFVYESPILERLPFMTINGNALAYDSESTLPGVAFRAVNEAYAESTGTITQNTEALSIFGGDADVDKFIVQTLGNMNDQRAVVTRMKVKSIVQQFQDSFINGSTAVNPKAFNGLKVKLTGTQVITAGVNGLPVVGNGTTDPDAFFDVLNQLIYQVVGGQPDALLMNRSILLRIQSAMRRKLIYNETRDSFGRPYATYGGIPLLDVGYQGDVVANSVIPQTETTGTSAVTSSIYAVRFGGGVADRAVTGLTNGGVQVIDKGLLEVQNVYRTNIEFYCGLAVFGKGAARLAGVLDA